MENMEIYQKLAVTPDEAKKPIRDGRLKGLTDIQPMYRIKRLTEVFGPCGIGWKYVIKSQRIETASNNEMKAFVDIDFFYKWNGEWSEPIPGIGGNAFLSHQKNGDYANDDCFKSALSDAIGTAAKALGMCADVYYAADRTKYCVYPENEPAQPDIDPKVAASYVMPFGDFRGMQLRDLYNANKKYMISLLDSPNVDDETKRNVAAVLNGVKAAKQR